MLHCVGPGNGNGPLSPRLGTFSGGGARDANATMAGFCWIANRILKAATSAYQCEPA